jgi:hypothetical protein
MRIVHDPSLARNQYCGNHASSRLQPAKVHMAVLAHH